MSEDELGVLDSTAFVVERARFVSIDLARVADLAARLAGETLVLPGWDCAHYYCGDAVITANFVLVLDALNFSFWGEPRWRVSYRGELLDGYFALAAALKRAVEEDSSILDATYLAQLKPTELAYILRGSGRIPLFDERLANLQEVGRVLLAEFDGSFAHAVDTAGNSATSLAALIVRNFPSFDDVASYEGREIRFYKRAQICVADLWGAFKGEGRGHFQDLEKLTAFADYKVPQMLRHFGVLNYDSALAERVDAGRLLAPGGTEEVEIRAATIWGVEYLRQAMTARGMRMRAFELDWHLWSLSQGPNESMMPYHRTRTIYY